MTITVEIMLRGNDRVFVEKFDHAGDPSAWTPSDLEVVLKEILRAIARVQQGDPDRAVHLRGLNWIVSPYKDGVVIAMEIHSASAVAGPFDIPAAVLESLVVRAVGSVVPGATIH